MSRAVGVELTDGFVRLLSLEQAGRKTKILLTYQAPIPETEGASWDDRAAQALRDAFAASRLPRSRVVVSIDSGLAVLREVALPFKNEEQIRKTVRFELESLIHNHSIDDLLVAHYKTGETDKGTSLLAAAVPKDVVGRTLKIFEKAGVDPVAVDLDACAVFNAAQHAGAVDTDAPHLLVYGTSKFTKLILVENRRPRSIRTIRFAMSEAAPEALVGILSKEISRFLLAQAATSTPAHILLSGDFETPAASAAIEAATGIPVKTFDLLQGAPAAGPAAVTLGLALKGAGIDALGMDFRQEEFQYRRKFDAIKTTALVTAELAIVLLAALTLHLWFKRTDLRKANAWMLEQQREVYRAAANEEVADPLQAYLKMEELWKKASQGTAGDSPLIASGRDAWIELYQALQRFQQKYATQKLGGGELYLELDGLEIQQTTTPGNESLTLIVRGRIRNHEYAGVLKNEVRAGENFESADWSAPFVPVEAEGGLYQFSLKAVKTKAKRNA